MLDSHLLAALAAPDLTGLPRQELLYKRLKAAILDGRLPGGLRLPASRQLAADLKMARNGVIHAYQQLLAEGFLTADRGGTRVTQLPGLARQPAMPSEAVTRGARPELSQRASDLAARAVTGNAWLPFSPGVPDLASFPWAAWSRALQRAWSGVTVRQLAYAEPGGEPALRQAVAHYLAARRGVVCTPAQVFLVAGSQMALDACARLLADPGDVVWLENPGYPAARNTMLAAGLTAVPVTVDECGMAPSPSLWETRPPRLIYLTPSHQYPMGSVLSLSRRLDFLQKSASTASWLIEDDYDCEFQHLRHSRRPLPAMQGLHPAAAVVYVGTFSKLLYPGLRIAYMVVPPWAVGSIGEGIAALYRGGLAIEQQALATLLENGTLTRHERRMAPIYRGRQQVLREALTEAFGTSATITGGDAGLHLTLHLVNGPPDVAVAKHAAALGVVVRPLSEYAVQVPGQQRLNGLVLGYGMVDAGQIPALVQRLAAAVSRAA
ncbi:PLP-dependent aminotransferase family protein [Dechloromonas sp.]|uniref:MocR-like pyridoxine biosynthesis transcription factor PdxR n=1 Tax=Dechloromonas sp. TaxID=1917218 RepID=UPI001213B266|nr:PLP-dependent aminotransferase family protein [Dechloromonas sp.]MBU3697007.1 PLP-dependent aminotransferase family protein [Dechloromonas sp.]TEX49585.1 MAG: GntR family transcriptional regulator [Rhodocyclaceae bacterium]